MALSNWLTKETVAVVNHIENWQEAIELTGQMLIKNGTIRLTYLQSIYKQQEELGHYYVLGPGVAMPHSRPKEGVNKIGLSLLIVREGIHFDVGENDPIYVILMLAATDSLSHIKIIQEVAELFSNDDYLNKIKKISNKKELLKALVAFDEKDRIR